MPRLIERLRNKHFLSLSGNAIMSLLSMATIAILCRVISLEAFGIWVFFQTVIVLIDTFRSGFITTGFIKFYSGVSTEKAQDVEGSAWYISLWITVILSIINAVALIAIPYVQNQSVIMIIKWFSICFWSMLPYFIGTCILQAEQRFDRLLVLRFITQGSFIIMVICLAIFTTITLQNLVIAYVLSFLFADVYCILKRWINIANIKRRTPETVSTLYNFGKFTVGTTISANLFRTSDTLIINFLLGPASLAVYNIGQRLMELVEIPLRSFAATGMPELAVAYNRDKREEVIQIMKKYAGMLTVVLVPVCISGVLLADTAISIIGGGKYVGTEAANVFRLFLTFALLYPADRFFALTLDVIHLPKINFYKVLVMLAANIIFDLLGIYIFKNVYGVAITTVIPIIIAVVVGFWALNKYYIRFSFFSIYKFGFYSLKELINSYFKKK